MSYRKGVFLWLFLVLILSGCITLKDSPAPGCIERISIIPVFGGCFGTTAMLDLQIHPVKECLVVTANNCNGGIVEISNTCASSFFLEDLEILNGGSASLDISQSGADLQPIEVWTNFSEFVPEQDTQITWVGTIDSEQITLSFTKTAQLCE